MTSSVKTSLSFLSYHMPPVIFHRLVAALSIMLPELCSTGPHLPTQQVAQIPPGYTRSLTLAYDHYLH